LGPPAEPTDAYGAARPEWYYLFLFQLLKHAPTEFIGAIVIPGAVMGFLFAMPLLANVTYLHVMNVAVLVVIVGTAGYLTYEAVYHDSYASLDIPEPDNVQARLLHIERVNASEDFQRAQHLAELEAERAVELVRYYGVPKEGVTVSLMRNDPEIQGPRLFERNCASCHSYTDEASNLHLAGPRPPRDEEGNLIEEPEPFGAPNLGRFASKDWVLGMLKPETIVSDDYFGRTIHGQLEDGSWKSGGMVEFVHDSLADAEPAQLEAVAAAVAAQANLTYEELNPDEVERGQEAMMDLGCFDCHKLGEEGYLGAAPDLTGYGSVEWIKGIIANPDHERFYEASGNDRMPAFAKSDDEQSNLLSDHDLNMLARWIRGDDRQLGDADTEPSAARESDPEPANEAGDDADENASAEDADSESTE